MQSSATTAFRACVMLACLVAIPAAALFGTSLPGIVQNVLQGKLSLGQRPAEEPLSEAPPFRPDSAPSPPAATAAVSNPALLTGGPTVLPLSDAGAAAALPATGWPAGGPVGPASPATNPPVVRPENIAPSVSPGGAQRAVWADDQSRPRSGVVPAGATQTAGEHAAVPLFSASTASVPPAGGEPASAAATPTDRFSYLQLRLRQLGATYYLLETWGDRGQFYRFHCRMAVVPGGNFTRQFEATDTDPLRAMTRVVSEVEAWRRSGQ